jgi:hypothetical protein
MSTKTKIFVLLLLFIINILLTLKTDAFKTSIKKQVINKRAYVKFISCNSNISPDFKCLNGRLIILV